MRRRSLFGLVCGAAFAATGAYAQDMQFFRLGSGGAGGTYFPVAGLMAQAVSNPPGSRPCEEGGACGVPGLVAVAQSTHGALDNVNLIQAGEIESGLVSADILAWAVAGEDLFADRGAYADLRTIAVLFPEHLQLVLPAGTSLGSLADLAGKRVGIGLPNSGTQVIVSKLLEQNGVTRDAIEVAELDNMQSAEALAAGDLDAYFFVGGIPTAGMVQLARLDGLALYDLKPEEIEALLAVVPHVEAATIPSGTYAGVDEQVATVAVTTQWVTNVNQPDDLIFAITEALWNDNSRRLFDTGHLRAADIRSDTALRDLAAPLHPGAERFYEAAGLLP